MILSKTTTILKYLWKLPKNNSEENYHKEVKEKTPMNLKNENFEKYSHKSHSQSQNVTEKCEK